MLEIKDGKIYVDEVETIDPELIGMAFLDFAEQMKESGFDLGFSSQNILNPVFIQSKS